MDVEAPGSGSGNVWKLGGQGWHNKPVGCGASGAYAPGPDDKEEEEEEHSSFVLIFTGRIVLHFPNCTKLHKGNWQLVLFVVIIGLTGFSFVIENLPNAAVIPYVSVCHSPSLCCRIGILFSF